MSAVERFALRVASAGAAFLALWYGVADLALVAIPVVSFDTLDLAVRLSLPVGVAAGTAWAGWARRHDDAKLTYVIQVLLRYHLAFIMAIYACCKIFPVQFHNPYIWTYDKSALEFTGYQKAWFFMNHSRLYQMFAGGGELAGALLLLLPSTVTLGACILAAIMTNVFAMNVVFDIGVQRDSGVYLVMILVLLWQDRPRLTAFFLNREAVSPRPPTLHRRLNMTVVRIIALVFIFSASAWQVHTGRTETGGLSPLYGAWRLDSPRKGFTTLYFTIGDLAAVKWADGHTTRLRCALRPGTETLILRTARPSQPFRFDGHYRSDGSRLEVSGHLDGEPLHLVLTRVSMVGDMDRAP